jgi:glycosyltransferase involved in cell wall biosynthesis
LNPAKRSLRSKLLDGFTFRINPLAALRSRDSANIVRAGRRVIAERGVELLEMEETFGLAQLVKRSLPIPIVVQIHGPFFVNGACAGLLEKPGTQQRLKNEGIAISQADGITAPSQDILDRTRAYYQLPLAGAIVAPPPAPAVAHHQRWRLTDCDRNATLFVGRFDRHKGGDIVIDAFRRLAPRFPHLRLWCVGDDRGFVDDGGKEWTLREYIAAKAPEVAERIDVFGRIPTSDLERLRSRAYCTMIASRYENFPSVVLEALAFGCPTVATRTGGIPEIVEDGVNGLLCLPGDSEVLSAALGRLLSDSSLAARLGERAREDVARRYDPIRHAQRKAEFYLEVIERHSARRRPKA